MRRVLVANRGEIAVRIIRACHEEGIEAVAVYSEVDRLSPHVRAADAAVGIGPGPRAADAGERGGLVLVGPPPAAIRAMGEKTAARERMAKAGVAVVPGTTEPVPDAAAAGRAAQTIGYPGMLKAVAGGGGRGGRG